MSSHGKCNGCGKGFGIFKKQDSCANCGLTFCNKCVDHKVSIPKLEGKAGNVCLRCFNIITGKIKDNTQKRDISPPANFIRNLQMLQEKQEQSGGPRRSSLKSKGALSDPVVKKHLKPEYRNLSIEDMEIAERIEKLSEDRKDRRLPPIQDVEQRLARLQGLCEPEATSSETPTKAPPTHKIPPTKPVTQQEETSNLLNQVSDEVNIDRGVSGEGEPTTQPASESKAEGDTDLSDVQSLIAQAAEELEIDAQKAIIELKKNKDIMARLERLKSRKSIEGEEGGTSEPTEKSGAALAGGDSSDEESEESQVKTILQQVLEEHMLDEKVEAEGGFKPLMKKQKSVNLPPPKPEEIDPDELPWCCICNEDATIRCLGCDMDLYCRRCYKEGHHNLYDDDHESVAYKKPASAYQD